MKPSEAQAKDYAAYRHGYSSTALAYIKERTQICNTTRLLDLACGTGLLLKAIQAEVALACGLDSSPAMLRQADRAGERPPSLMQGTAYALPFVTQAFDTVTIAQAIHWFDLKCLMPELKRVLRSNGWLVIISKYPAPNEPYRPLFEYLLEKYQAQNKTVDLQLTTSLAVGNILGLEAVGFGNYERRVFEWQVETPLEVYVNGCCYDPRVASLPAEQQAMFRAELAQCLRRQAGADMLTEIYFDYVISVQRH